VGSRFLKKPEAAQMLGVHVRTIGVMIVRGALRPVREGRYVGVWEEDVIALRNDREKGDKERVLPFALNRETVLRHEREIRVLRHDMDQVLKVLHLRREELKVSDLEMSHLYKQAKEYAENGWPPQIEETWVGYFLRIRTDNFSQIERTEKEVHPWKPFLKLVSIMLAQPYNTELSLQLSAARDHIMYMTSVWFELKRISPRVLDGMVRRESRPNKRLLGVLCRRQKKLAAKG
jgi:hypothetical protein